MVTVTIDEDILIEMLVNRVRYWTSDESIIDLYRDYYEGLACGGCFEGCIVNIMCVVDNDYLNNLATISKEDFEQWSIESEMDDKVVAFNKEEDLYLIQTY